MNKKQLQWLFYEKRYNFRDYWLNRIISRHLTVPLWGFEPHIYLYGGKFLHGAKWANKRISDLIRSDEPFMVARFGNTELNVMNAYKRIELFGDNQFSDELNAEWWEKLNVLSGFFPNDIAYEGKFSNLLYESMLDVDLLGVWTRRMEDYYLRTEMKQADITALRWMEPWYSDEPWTWALEGKKVLVIHPFEKSIRSQYEKRKELFPENELLPEFELDVIKAVQTVGDAVDDRFETWFDALDYMYNEAISRDFDVAIIGCGAYGMPLASMLKKAGKKAIHLGGVTQCLFGIKGSRWIDNPRDKKMPINEAWVYPDDEETPKGSTKVENNCYWK
ncbi:hypothetical protein [Butyrivibrio fibrisolvens]|uniref:hypothetical protein n=1 Tax=Butyrivibrio fibrisolvens TaxID=831 RepID=UPI0004245CF6|nr:hypothetical protein [Butyrivibrio fibrisolvens]